MSELDIEKEIEKARASILRRSRILLHKDTSSAAQKMIVVLFHDSKVGMHRHPPSKSETYLALVGELEVNYLDEQGEQFFHQVTPVSNQSKEAPKIVSHRGGAWHEPRSLTDFCVYLEIYDGPFRKEEDVEYRDTF